MRYAPTGLVAVDPRAFFALFEPPAPPTVEMRDGVALATVRGPLEHHHTRWSDSYDAIAERVAEALALAPRAVVLCIDSPGGAVSGCFDTARRLRAMARAAGVPLYAFIEGQGCSAAYALACAADRVFASETAYIGSIGIIEALIDGREADKKMGFELALVTSGARKADGHPSAGVTDDARSAAQKRVDDLARSFFTLVEEMRGVPAAEVAAMEASVVLGPEAVEMGLADELATLDQVLAIASNEEEEDMPAKASQDIDDAIAKLRKAAEGDDEEAAKRARRMLAAMDEDETLAEGDEDETLAEGDEDEPAAMGEDEDDPAARKAKASDDPESDEDETLAESDEDDAKAIALQALRQAHALRAEREAEREKAERERLLASRPDFDDATIRFLSKPSTSLAQVRDAVKTFPRGPVRIAHNPLAAAAQVAGTQGANQGAHFDRLPPDEAAELDRKMGLRRDVDAIKHTGTLMSLGVMTKAQARELARRRAAERNAGQ